jgi:hypothetical protein
LPATPAAINPDGNGADEAGAFGAPVPKTIDVP